MKLKEMLVVAQDERRIPADGDGEKFVVFWVDACIDLELGFYARNELAVFRDERETEFSRDAVEFLAQKHLTELIESFRAGKKLMSLT